MYEVGYMGRYVNLLEAAAAICDHDIFKVAAIFAGQAEKLSSIKSGGLSRKSDGASTQRILLCWI